MAPLDEDHSIRSEPDGAPLPSQETRGVGDLPDERELETLSRGLRTDLRRLGVPEDSTHDMVQETWLRALRRPGRVTNLPSWLRVVSRRLAWEWRRTDRNRRDRELLGVQASRSESPAEERAGGESPLAKLVRERPQPYSRAVELRYLEGYSPREIAHLLGCPPATVRSWLKRGLEILRRRLPEDPEQRKRYLGLAALALRHDLERLSRAPRGLGGSGARLLVLGAAGLALVLAVLGILEIREPRDDQGEAIARSPTGSGFAVGPRAAEEAGTSRDAASEPEARPVPPRPSLVGVVRDPEGRPVPGAHVHVGGPRGGSEEPPAATSDAQGRYALFGLGAEAVIWATSELWCESFRCYVATVGPEGVFDLRLEPGATRRLRFEDSEGESLAGALVLVGGPAHPAPELREAGALEFPPGPERGRCDARGEVEIRLPEMEEHSYEIRSSDGRVRRGRFTIPVCLAEGELLVVRLAALSTLEGRASLTDGRPAAGARVEALQGGESTGASRVESDGTFRLAGLPPGAYDLRVFFEGAAHALDSFAESGQLAEGEVKRREIVLSPEHGLVAELVAPVSLIGATVEVTPLSLYSWERASRCFELPDDGLLVVPACRPVEHWLRVRFADGSTSFCRERVVPGSATQHLSIEAPRLPGDVLVQVTGEDPAVRWTSIELRDGFGPGSLVGSIDPATGVATLHDVPGGFYVVHVWAPGFGTWAFREGVLLPAPDLLRLTLPRGSPVTLDVQVPPGVDPELLKATVVVPGFNALGFEGDGARLIWKRLVRTGPARFATELPPGEYRFRVRCPGASEFEQRLQVPSHGELRVAVPLRLSTAIALTLVPERPLARGEGVRFEVLDEVGTSVREGTLTSLETPFLMIPFEAHRILFHTPGGLRGELALERGDLSGGAPPRHVVRLAEPSASLSAREGLPEAKRD